MNKVEEYENDELSIWNLNSIFNFIKENYIQLFLFILVFVIIYVVDYISNINAGIFSMPSVIPSHKSEIKEPKRQKRSKK